MLERDLDEGESEVIALAIERQADLILLDETDARQVAERYRLPKTGVIGVLIRAGFTGSHLVAEVLRCGDRVQVQYHDKYVPQYTIGPDVFRREKLTLTSIPLDD